MNALPTDLSEYSPQTFPELAAAFALAQGSERTAILGHALLTHWQACPLDNPGLLAGGTTAALQCLSLWGQMQLLRGQKAEARRTFKYQIVLCEKEHDRPGSLLAAAYLHAAQAEERAHSGASAAAIEEVRAKLNLQLALAQRLAAPALAPVALELCRGLLALGSPEDLENAQVAIDLAHACDRGQRGLELTLAQIQWQAATGQVEAGRLWLEDLLENPLAFADPLDARLCLRATLIDLLVRAGDPRQALRHAYQLRAEAQEAFLPLAQASAATTLALLEAALGRDEEVTENAALALQMVQQLHLAEGTAIALQAALATALSRLGRSGEALDFAEEVADWARAQGQGDLAREYTALAAAEAARDQQFIRAAGLFGQAAELCQDHPLERARNLRSYAKQVVYSAGTNRQAALEWALSLMREAHGLLRDLQQGQLQSTGEVGAELQAELGAWQHDQLWIRTRAL